MKFDSIEVLPASDELGMLLNFEDPNGESPYQVLEIEDLDAGDLLKSYYARGQSSGKKFFNFSLPKREPVIKVGLNPRLGEDETVSSLRDDIYRMISSTRDGTIWLRFMDGDNEVAVLTGTIGSVEPSLFDKRPTVDIRLECDDPILRATTKTEIDMPDTATDEVAFLDLYSTAPHGLFFVATFEADASNLTITDSSGDWFFTVTPKDGFDRGDEIWFAGEANTRSITRFRKGKAYPLADVVAKNSVWPIVFPLSNEFLFNHALKFASLGHFPAYWGV